MRRSTLAALGVWAACGAGAGVAHGDLLFAGPPRDSFELSDAVTGLGILTSFAFLPDGRIVTTDKEGAVVLVDEKGVKTTIGTFAVDTGAEKGLLNVLVHPDFARNRRLLFFYSAAASIGGTNADRNRVVSVPLNAKGMLDMAQEIIIIRGLKGPSGHTGGGLTVGTDGRLYLGVGDTGCNSDTPVEPPYPPTNFFGTCLTVPNGKILRVELDGSIPSDNPLVGKQVTACDGCLGDIATTGLGPASENIWAWGFRNPWRMWTDPLTGNLWVGDVGEVSYEELNVIPKGGGGKHYGWPWREGKKGHPASACRAVTPDVGNCVDPDYTCEHADTDPDADGNCRSITGGLIVDSCQFPESFRHRYFFADSTTGRLWTLRTTPDRSSVVRTSREDFINVIGRAVHLDVGPDGSLYYASLANPGNSRIVRVAPKVPATCPVVPDAGSADASVDASLDAASGGRGAGGVEGPDAGQGGAGGTTGAGGTAGSGGGTAGSGGGASASAGGVPAGAGAGGVASDGAADGASSGGKSGDDSGCGCRMPAARARGGAPLVGLLAAAALWARVKRRRRSQSM